MAASQIRVVDTEVMSRSWILGVFKVKAAGLAVCLDIGSKWGAFQRGLQTSLLNNLQDRVATDQDEWT